MMQKESIVSAECDPESLPVAISDSVWRAVVSFPQEPARETERLYQLMREALQAWSTAKTGATQVAFGLYCEPGDGNVRARLWQALHLYRRADRLLIALPLN
ncbi:TPA: hypothetical protein ACIAIE_001991 [Serratia fonticola]